MPKDSGTSIHDNDNNNDDSNNKELTVAYYYSGVRTFSTWLLRIKLGATFSDFCEGWGIGKVSKGPQ